MRLRVYKTPTFKYHFIFQKQYSADKNLVSIGHDCHPAYMLQFLNIRKKSLVLDWIYTEPDNSLTYIRHNIETEFRDFLKDLKLNQDNKVISALFPTVVFFHSNDLIDNPETYATYQRRAKRFLDIYNNQACSFLWCVSALNFKSLDYADRFIASVKDFQGFMKADDELLIYFKYEESLEEGHPFCEKIMQQLAGLDRVKIAQFNRQMSKNGIWGNKKQFIPLLNELGVKIKREMPLITIKKSLRDRQ